MPAIGTIIWDWNGTLLNDAGLCVETINQILEQRGKPKLDASRYQEVFGFPIQSYYQRIGLSDNFDEDAISFVELYARHVRNCPLQQEAASMLKRFAAMQIRQVLLSAMEHAMLTELIRHYDLDPIFAAVAGLNDHLAKSKVEIGRNLLRQFEIERNETLLVGDTTHDFEVAQELGITCILIPSGHQSRKRLQATGAPVLDSLGELNHNLAAMNV